jgi:hypothetical protein
MVALLRALGEPAYTLATRCARCSDPAVEVMTAVDCAVCCAQLRAAMPRMTLARALELDAAHRHGGRSA